MIRHASAVSRRLLGRSTSPSSSGAAGTGRSCGAAAQQQRRLLASLMLRPTVAAEEEAASTTTGGAVAVTAQQRRFSSSSLLLPGSRHRAPPSVQQQQRAWFGSYPAHQVVGLPSLSPTMESGSIASWNLKEGDAFGAGDIFCSVETDKATVDFEAQDEGVLAKILVEAGGGAEIKVGDPIMVIVDSEDDVSAFKDFKAEPAAAAQAEPAAAAAPPPPPPPEAPAPAPEAAAPSTAAGGRVVASPLAHLLAKEMGYDIGAIAGTGPGGRIIAADVKEFVPSAAAAAAAAASDVQAPAQAAMAEASASPGAAAAAATPVVGEGYKDYPLSDQAREVATRLMQSKRNVPHYYLTVDVSVDELLQLRSKLNDAIGSSSEDAPSIGVYELLLKAAAMSMKAVPSANASWMDSVVRVYDSVDINVVVGSGDALTTPVIRDCAGKGVRKISQELHGAVSVLEDQSSETAADAASGDVGVGSFTVVNLGMYGIKSCAPIIREPQSCALAIGSLENRIVPNDDPDSEEIYKESVVFTATLSCDHRVVDGAVGAQWLSAFKSHVENPSTLLL